MVGKVGKYRCKTIRTHSREPVMASINQQEIRQVVLNLVTNALESVDCDGAVDVDVRSSEELRIRPRPGQRMWNEQRSAQASV